MDAEGWLSLLMGAGVLGSLALCVWIALQPEQDVRFQPVWLVLLEGGIDGRDPPDDSDGGGGRWPPAPPRVPPHGHASGRAGGEYRRGPAPGPVRRPRVARGGAHRRLP